MTDVTYEEAGSGRPTAYLPVGHLVRISLYWLGLTAIDGAVGGAIQSRIQFESIVPKNQEGMALALVGLLGTFIGVLIQPTVGSISDYTTSRWGRRKPYIVVGSLLDVVFLVGIAQSHTVISIAAFVALLAFSTNIARGPFQGYVPDLVPTPQVGTASAMVGLMQILGNVTGFGLAAIANVLENVGIAIIAVAIVELVTMISVVVNVGNGPAPRPREGKSWLAIARETWGTDILRERSYVWLVASRLFVLGAGATFVNLIVSYLGQSLGKTQSETGVIQIVLLVVVAVANLIIIMPAARVSDRIGRKPVIYASCAIGAVGLAIAAVAPDVLFAAVGAGLFGVSAGMFLAVDWALMTDIIPKASSGRYMGMSNLATGLSVLFAYVTAFLVMDPINALLGYGVGPRVAFLAGVVFFVIGALLLRPVVEPIRRKAAIAT